MSEPAVRPAPSRRGWITPGVLGIVLATFFSDFGHEGCTAVLPLYLGGVSLGAGLGVVEGLADFCVSLSKLAGGVAGHRLRHKRALTAAGYVLTGLLTAAIGLVTTLTAVVSLRSAAWVARGFRGPLRDDLLAEAVAPTHGRAYGLERTGDMLGAVAGPLAAALLVWAGLTFSAVILWTAVPGLLAAAAIWFLTRDPAPAPGPPVVGGGPVPAVPFPRLFWGMLVGVGLFGLGDFSRAFLVLLVARALGEEGRPAGSTLSLAVLLYAAHNLVSAAAAYGIGHLADRVSKMRLLLAGYVLGVATNGLLALFSTSLPWLIVAIALSGVYLAAEETLEKAAVAGVLPRGLRSLGFGILACANAVGDMVSSVAVGALLDAGLPGAAFGGAAAVGAVGVLWLAVVVLRAEAAAPA